MVSDSRKEEVLKALYAAASDPKQHQDFVEKFDIAFAESDKEAFREWIEPHIDTATTIFEKLNFAGALEKTSSGIVQQFSEPAAIVTERGDIIASNEEWDEMCSVSRLDEITRLEEDRASIRAATQALHAILEDRTRIVRLHGAIEHVPVLSFRRLPVIDERTANGGTILVRSLGVHWSEAMLTFLREEMGISETELTILPRIVDGETLSDIAVALGRGRETIKSHAKSIYDKFEVSGREALVKLVLQIHNLLGTRVERPFVAAPTGERGRMIELSTGQRLYCEEKGALEGRRLLFLHGLSLGHHFSQGFQAELIRAGITLLCIERPGYGRSDPPKNWKKGLEEWIDLFPSLLKQLDLAPGPIVTQTGGVMLASAAASHHPQLVTGICAFAAGIPITDRQKLSEYPPQIRLVSRAARLSPSILRFIITNGTQYFRTPEGRERTIARTYASSPIDREGLKDPDTHDQVRASIEMIADGGFDGFISDNLHMFGDWSRFSKTARCEIAYLNGTEDPICPIEWSREFSNQAPNMSVTAAVGAGNLMLHTHPARCMEHLRACLERFDANS